MKIMCILCQKEKLKRETLIKYYDLIRPTRCVVEESQRYLRLEHEDSESYVSYFTVNAIVGELDFPSSEIFLFPATAIHISCGHFYEMLKLWEIRKP